MQIRPITPADLDALREIDGTIESLRYLHLEQSGEGLATAWKLEERALRQKLIDANRLSDDIAFAARQIVTGADEGLAVLAEHDESPVAMMIAQPNIDRGTYHLLDLRIDYEFRRQGLGTVLAYQLISAARDRELRAVSAETQTSNFPGNQLLVKLGFMLSGVDTRRWSNHDIVKESATLLWYMPLD